MIKRRFFKIATVALMVAMTMSLTACTGCSGCKNNSTTTSAESEATTQTDILAVEIVDKDGNKHVVEGVGVTDESGKTTITVTDKDGNKTVIEGTATKDENGNTTVTGGTVVEGGTITKDDGTKVDTSGSKVEDVKDNNDGKIETDVKVDETVKAEVESKKEEATKGEVSTQAPTKNDVANNKETEKATEKETEGSKENETTAAKETQGQTSTPTTAPTTAPTQTPTTAPTQAPTTAPAETPTQKPMTEEEKAIAECLENSDIVVDKADRVSISYEGSAEKIVVPATYSDGRPITFFYLTSNSTVKEVVVLGADTMSHFQENHKLEKITTYANMIDATLISTCSNIKEVNLLGDNITFIKNGFVQYNSLSYPADFRGATLNINLKKIDDVMTYGHPVYLPDRMKTIKEFCAGYTDVERYGLEYAFFNKAWVSTQEYRNWFSKINFLK